MTTDRDPTERQQRHRDAHRGFLNHGLTPGEEAFAELFPQGPTDLLKGMIGYRKIGKLESDLRVAVVRNDLPAQGFKRSDVVVIHGCTMGDPTYSASLVEAVNQYGPSRVVPSSDILLIGRAQPQIR